MKKEKESPQRSNKNSTKIYNLSVGQISRHGLDVVGWFRVEEKSNSAERIFRSNYGTSSTVVQDIWRLIGENISDEEIRKDEKRLDHFFWSFIFMKVYGTETNHFTMVHEKPTEKTFRKWSSKYLRYIYFLFPHVVSFYFLHLYLHNFILTIFLIYLT